MPSRGCFGTLFAFRGPSVYAPGRRARTARRSPMLLDIRETVRNSKPIKYTLIGLISVPFALVGIGSYFAGGTAPAVATVDGEEIDAYELDRAYRQQRQRFAQVFGGRIPEALDDEQMLRRQALDALVAERVLAGEVAAQRFAVGDETLGRAIRERPEFQVDGRFDRDRYAQLVASAGGVTAFEAQYRDQTALDQFRGGVVATGFTLPEEAARVDALARQRRTVDALRFDLDAAKAGIEVSDEDVAARFEETADEYRFPPRARIAYLELSADTIADTLEADEADARAWYRANESRFGAAERREASHILLAFEDGGGADEVAELTAEAEALGARLEAGEPFDELAAEASDDAGSAAGGGRLGEISPGLMDAPFEEAVFALGEAGDVSAPVVTDFGVHLIRLDDVVPGTVAPFDEADEAVREEAFAGARREAALEEFAELREALAEAAFDEPESLEAAAEATGLTVRESDWLDADTDSGPVLSHPGVREAMFSEDVLQEGNNSEPVEVGERHVVVLRTIEDEDERPKSLDDVGEEVADAIAAERAEAALDERAAAAEAELADGAEPAALAEGEDGVEALSAEGLTRDAGALDAGAVAALFAAPAPAEGAPVTGVETLGDGDQLAWRLVSVERPEVEVARSGEDGGGETTASAGEPSAADPPAAPPTPSGADPRLGDLEFSALMGSLRERADVEIADDLSPELPDAY